MTLAEIEALYQGPVGADFLRRCGKIDPKRASFWRDVAQWTGAKSVLEVGCGPGNNLVHLRDAGIRETHGVDISGPMLSAIPMPIGRTQASAARLPFTDGAFEMVMTCGLLLHVPAEALPQVQDELVRCARAYILICEYEDAREREIPWRGYRDVLWARPQSFLLWQRHPELQPIMRGELTPQQGFDQMTYALFVKSAGRPS